MHAIIQAPGSVALPGQTEDKYMLKPMAENLISLKHINGNKKEIKNKLFFPIGGALEKLEDIIQSDVNLGNQVIFLKLDQHGLEYDPGNYDLTFDLFREGNVILYQTKNASVEDVGSDTMKIEIHEDVKKVL